MELTQAQLENIVSAVMQAVNHTQTQQAETQGDGMFSTVDDAVEAAYGAYRAFRRYSLSDREHIIQTIREDMLKEVEHISRLALEETGMGNFADKVKKNILAIQKTPGTEDLRTDAYSGDNGLTLVELSPFGVIASITPSTNPTATIINNAIGMIAAGNGVVFCPHPNAKNATLYTIAAVNRAIAKAGGPKNLICTLTNPSQADVTTLLQHPKVNLIAATGGPGLVRMALSSGKKAIGAGAGNPPAIVDETADIEQAAQDIVNGASFDNNLPCIAEKEVIVVESVADYLIFNMQKHGAQLITDQAQKDKLLSMLITENGTPNKKYIGKDAGVILADAGIWTDAGVRLVIMEADKSHPFVQEELMMPVLPIVRVKDVHQAIDLAVEVEHNNRHTAIMHSKNVDNLTKGAKELQTTIFVKNAPCYAGIGFMGEGHTTFTIAGPTGEGLTSARSFARTRRCILSGGFSIR